MLFPRRRSQSVRTQQRCDPESGTGDTAVTPQAPARRLTQRHSGTLPRASYTLSASHGGPGRPAGPGPRRAAGDALHLRGSPCSASSGLSRTRAVPQLSTEATFSWLPVSSLLNPNLRFVFHSSPCYFCVSAHPLPFVHGGARRRDCSVPCPTVLTPSTTPVTSAKGGSLLRPESDASASPDDGPRAPRCPRRPLECNDSAYGQQRPFKHWTRPLITAPDARCFRLCGTSRILVELLDPHCSLRAPTDNMQMDTSVCFLPAETFGKWDFVHKPSLMVHP